MLTRTPSVQAKTACSSLIDCQFLVRKPEAAFLALASSGSFDLGSLQQVARPALRMTLLRVSGALLFGGENCIGHFERFNDGRNVVHANDVRSFDH